MLDEKIQRDLIAAGRTFMKGTRADDAYEPLFESDQTRKLPQPPLVKAAVTPEETHIPLTRDFSGLSLKNDLVSLFTERKSSRVYTEEAISIDELAFLLWATQGVKGIRGKNYATLRTVPCGGARHEFETYLAVRNVTGLRPGKYHYLPMEHALEYLGEIENADAAIAESLEGQKFAAKGAVVFYWSTVAYRAEWRYGIYAHRIALVDVGHVGENLYLACAGLGIGTCGIGAFSHELTCRMFDLDGDDEYIVYTAPVGRVKASDAAKEKAFYSFLDEE